MLAPLRLPAPSAEHYRRPLLHTPFFEASRPWIQTDVFVPWSGYLACDVYSSVEQEYFAIRNGASLLDLTPVVKYRIHGPDAERFLSHLVTCDLRKLKPGKVAYAVLCDDQGQVIDDWLVFRFAEQEFRVCCTERQLDWFADSAIGFEVAFEEVTVDIAALALQGPTSFAVLRDLGLQGLEALKPQSISQHRFDGHELMVSRTGFTGDLGYELWIAPEAAEALWQRLMDVGHSRGIRPIGLQALDMARIEAGLLLPDSEYISSLHTVRSGRESTPWELGLDWAVALDKGHFNGRRALIAQKERGLRRKLVGLELDGNKPGDHALVYADRETNRQVGEISAALWSPTCKRNIALARLDAPWCDGTRPLWVDIYLHRELQWERRTVRAWVVERPFYAPARRHATPPGER